MFQTIDYKIYSRQIPEEFAGFRIAQLSDLHGMLYGRNNKFLIEKIKEKNPHIIVMTGDMADTSPHSISRLLRLSRSLVCICPVYWVLGNHEQSLGNIAVEKLTKQLKSLGVIVTDNQWHTISRGGAFIKIYGLVMPMIYYKDRFTNWMRGVDFTGEHIRKLLGKADSSCFSVLLAHNPLYYPVYRDWGADLTFSGHIHGGVIQIPGMGGLLSPDVTLFPKYDGGYFQEKGRHLIVSRGLGNHFLMRVNNPPELVMATLLPETETFRQKTKFDAKGKHSNKRKLKCQEKKEQ